MRLRGIRDVEAANTFLRRECVTEFNRRFSVPAAEKGGGFVKCPRKDLDWVFSIQRKRRVNSDHSVVLDNRMFQTENNKWSRTLAGSTFVVHELRHSTVAIRYGPHEVARFAAAELPAGFIAFSCHPKGAGRFGRGSSGPRCMVWPRSRV